MDRMLAIQTPRAGLQNHRFLVPPATTYDETELARYFADATRVEQADDFLAVSQHVEQPSSGRQGREILLLAGIDVGALSPQQREQTLHTMRKRLDSIEPLLAKLDAEATRRLVVERKELQEWALDYADLPTARPPRSERKTKYPIVAAAVTVACLLLSGGKYFFFPANAGTDTSPAVNSANLLPGLGQADTDSEQPTLQQAVQEWQSGAQLPNPHQRQATTDANTFLGATAAQLSSDCLFSAEGELAVTGSEGDTQLEWTLDLIYRHLTPGVGSTNLRTVLADQGFRNRLATIYQSRDGVQQTPNLYGWLDHRSRTGLSPNEADAIAALRSLCPSASKESVLHFRQLVAIANELGAGDQTSLKHTLADDDVRLELLPTVQTATNFFPVKILDTAQDVAILTPADAMAAQAVVAWLSHPATNQLWNVTADEPLPQAVRSYVSQQRLGLNYMREDVEHARLALFAQFLLEFANQP